MEEGEDEEEDEGSDFSGSDEPNFSADVKLFVGNLPFTVDSSALATLFERAGNVEMVEVIFCLLQLQLLCSSTVYFRPCLASTEIYLRFVSFSLEIGNIL